MSALLIPTTVTVRAARAACRPGAAGVVRLRSDLKASVGDGVAYSLMVGLGETYLPAFVIALGMGEIAAALVVTVPLLAGAILQLAAPWAVARLGSYRHWVIVCAICQAASLLLLPIVGGDMPWIVFVAATLYWAAGLGTGPAWNTWIETVVPKRIRARFLATRVRACQATLLMGFIAGGLLLQLSSHSPVARVAFGALFFVAALSRIISAAFLTMHSDRVKPGKPRRLRGLGDIVRRRQGDPAGRLLLYLLATQAAVYISGPFFTPYMLSKLQLSYAQYTALIAVGYAGKVSALAAWGRFAQRAGAYRLLWIGGLGIVPTSVSWLVSDSLVYLSVIQFYSGVAWAAYELAMFLLFFDAIPQDERTPLLTLYNLGNSFAMVGGGLVGAMCLRWWGDSIGSYLMVFALSSVARLGAVSLLARVHAPVHGPSAPSLCTPAVRPARRSMERPVLASVASKSAREPHGLPTRVGFLRDVAKAAPA